MPELPEVETVRRTLQNFVAGKTIADVIVYYDKIVEGNTQTFIETLKGQTIQDIDRVGKYLIFILDRNAFISHLRMEGKYHFVDAGALPEKHEHLAFRFTDGTELRYVDMRKFGRLQLADREKYRCELPLSKLGPEPWDADIQSVYQRIHSSRLPIKSLLLDQTLLAGIGNIYANEICFQLGLNPKTPGQRLSKKRVGELLIAAREILERAIALGGTTVHSFDANGISGRFQIELQVHMQKTCPVCGGPVTKEMVGGRGTYYCRHCQKRRS